MNEMQAHGLLIPVGSKPFEVWIDKNNSLAELQDLVNGNVDVLSVRGNGVRPSRQGRGTLFANLR